MLVSSSPRIISARIQAEQATRIHSRVVNRWADLASVLLGGIVLISTVVAVLYVLFR
jgi:hypothetical protein